MACVAPHSTRPRSRTQLAPSLSARAAARGSSQHGNARCPRDAGSYVLCTRTGNTLFTAGHLPQPADGDLVVGKVGDDLTTEQGHDAAQYAALSLLATLKAGDAVTDDVTTTTPHNPTACSPP